MKRRRKSPRVIVAEHLMDLGFAVDPQEIVTLEGPWRREQFDCLDRWRVTVSRDGKEYEITGLHNLTECARGVIVAPNTPNSGVYGDFVAIAEAKSTKTALSP